MFVYARIALPSNGVNAYDPLVADALGAEPAASDSRVKGTCRSFDHPLPAETVEPAAVVLRALPDPTTLQMLNLLAEAAEPLCVCDFTAAFDLSQPTVSHHIAKLREAGLVESTKHGIWSYYSVAPTLPALARAVIDQLTH